MYKGKPQLKNDTVDLAVLSDIHGNYIALERCISYALLRGISTFIFLGDYVGEFPYPEKTMEILYRMDAQYKCYFVRGNKENYWIDYQDNGESGWQDNNSTTGSLLYTYNHLSKRDIAFFRELPVSQNIKIKNMPSITICHGSPYKVNQKLLPDSDETLEIMDAIETSIILCGHTHIQNKIENKGKVVLNGGAVGVPLYSNGQSQFMILHGAEGQWKEEFVSFEYDVERVIRELHLSGLDYHAPYWCMVTEKLLRDGNISHGKILKRAMSLCNNETGSCIWPDVPEKYWKQAVAEYMQDESK